jgi:hypothetical protein
MVPVNPASTFFLLILAVLAGCVLGGLMVWAWIPPGKQTLSLPSEWAVSARPVFNAGERRLYRQLRDAFPHYVVLPKLPLVRFCQPDDMTQVGYWYGLLGSIHVSFAVCTPSGRIVLAVDLQGRRERSKRATQIKEAVLAACRVKHLTSSVDQLPTLAELQSLIPAGGGGPGVAVDGAVSQSLNSARENLASTVASRRAERSAKGGDSGLFLDSFFSPDSRMDTPNEGDSQQGQLHANDDSPRSAAHRHASKTSSNAAAKHYPVLDEAASDADWTQTTGGGGVVVDDPVPPTRPPRGPAPRNQPNR